jgi:hypothetical protein
MVTLCNFAMFGIGDGGQDSSSNDAIRPLHDENVTSLVLKLSNTNHEGIRFECALALCSLSHHKGYEVLTVSRYCCDKQKTKLLNFYAKQILLYFLTSLLHVNL